MELLRHSFPNWFVWLLIGVFIAMTVIRKFRDMDRKDREINEAAEKEIKQTEERKQSYEASERERAEVRRMHKLRWRTADIARQLKLSTDRVRLDFRSEDSIDISIGGAFATMRELRDAGSHAKARLHEQDHPIVEADVEKLLSMLADAQQRIDAEMDSIVAKRDDGLHDDEFDGRFFVPTTELQIKIEKANSLPQEIIDLTLAAAKNGAKGAKVLYELIVAEMDVGVARFYVTWNTVDTESNRKNAPAWLAHYLAEQPNITTEVGEQG